jgi:BetI-type transcriptional repressor, C-terminal
VFLSLTFRAPRKQRVAERDHEVDREHERPEDGNVDQRLCAVEIADQEDAQAEKRGARRPREKMAQPFASLPGSMEPTGARRSPRRRAAGEAIRESRVGPADHAELLAFAMELVAERVRARVVALEPAADVRASVQRSLEQGLPLDAERRTEMEVWLAFTARAQVDRGLREQREQTYSALRQFIGRCIDALAEAGLMRPELSREVETSRLHAIVDGLALHGITSPETMGPRRARKILGAHLAALS